MSAKIAVLGLVIEEPSPAHRLTAKLRQRLSSAEFVDSNVYSALARLEREGLVRSCEESSYEATEEGVRHFEKWLFASSSAPPLRDELHMKIALCQSQNLPRMIELVYGQELVCLGRVQELKKSFERIRPPDPSRWSGLVMVMVRDAELAFWEARLGWLQGVRESLENMGVSHQDASRAERPARVDASHPELVARGDGSHLERVAKADASLQRQLINVDAGLQDASRRQRVA